MRRKILSILVTVNFYISDTPKNILQISRLANSEWRQTRACLNTLIQLGLCKTITLPGQKSKKYVLPSWSLFVEDPKSKDFNPNDPRHGSCEDCGIGLHKTKSGGHCSGYRFAGCFTPKDKVECVFSCPECGEKVTAGKRGYACIKGFTHLRRIHKVKSIGMKELDGHVTIKQMDVEK